jgi:hypothetical protein
MARTPVNWNPNRYGSVKHVLKFDATTGTYSLQEQNQSYNNTYSFTSLPSGNTQTQTSTNTNTQQTGTTSAQTTEAFGDVRPLYAKANDEDPFSAEYGKGTATDANTNVMGFEVDRSKMYDANEGHQAFDKGTSDLPPGHPNHPNKKFQMTPSEDIDMSYKEGDFNVTPKKSGLLSYKNVKSKMIDPAIQAAKSVFKTPAMMIIDAIAGEETVINKHDKQYFTAYTSGSMSGRITGDDGTYDPSNNLYHGMNRVSMHGNLEKAGAKRIARIERTIAKKKAKGQDTTTLEKRVANFKGEQKEYTQSKITAKHKSDLATGGVAPGASSGGTGGGSGPEGGKSIICTQMYQQTQLEDWKKTMQLWYIFQKKYLTMEHQEGYHFLFKPFVNGMKKSKVLTALGKHCAIARTNDIKHIMFGTPFSLSGRLVRLVTEPICYITGKIKSWL